MLVGQRIRKEFFTFTPRSMNMEDIRLIKDSGEFLETLGARAYLSNFTIGALCLW